MSKGDLRNVRVPEDLWGRAKAAAEGQDDTLSDVIRVALERYARRYERAQRKAES